MGLYGAINLIMGQILYTLFSKNENNDQDDHRNFEISEMH